MRVTVTGATGGIGTRLVAALQARGDEVTVLSRDAERARRKLGDVESHAWDPAREPAPSAALEGRDVVVNLAGESVAQRWTDDAKARIRSSRVDGTRHLVAGIKGIAEGSRPLTLVSGSAIGFYGDRREETPESAPKGEGFLADVCEAWEAEARRAEALGLRVVLLRTGDVLMQDDGVLPVLAKLTKFGVMGPLGGGKQAFPWIHVTDHVGLTLHTIDSVRASGPVNMVAPGIVTQAQLARALGKALRRPAFAPAPAFAVRALRGEMADLILEGARAVPAAARELGYTFAYPELPAALDEALGA